MTGDRLGRFWVFAALVLITIIVTSGIIICLRFDRGQPIEVSLQQVPQFQGQLYIAGAVTNPGLYPLNSSDKIDVVLDASGGVIKDADLSRMQLYIPRIGEREQPQKININRADVWLLQALPNIGQAKAQAIIDYRQKNGPFRSLEDLVKVPGISNSTFEKLKDFTTITEDY
jgi:competence protein ComEA